MPEFNFNVGARQVSAPTGAQGPSAPWGARQPAQATESPWQARWAGLQTQKATDPSNRQLTAVEHDAFSRALIERFGPIAGRAAVAGAIPAWQAAKAITQPIARFVPGAQSFFDAIMPSEIQPHRGSAPGWDQLMTGLAPIWSAESPSWASEPTSLGGWKPAQAEDSSEPQDYSQWGYM